MLSCESLHTSAPPLHSGNQCQTKWTVQRVLECVDVCLFLLLELLQIIMITVLEQFGCLCMSQCVYQAFLAFT